MPPKHITFAHSAANATWKEPPLTAKPFDRCARRRGLAEGVKQEFNRRANRFIRINYDRSIGVIEQANWQRQLQLTTARLVTNPALQAGLENMQFCLPHGTL